MIKNYIKTALRNLIRNRVYVGVNVLGLSLGITCSIVLVLLALYATSYNTFNENYDRIYRIVNSSQDGAGGEMDHQPGVPIPLPEAIKLDFPEFEQVVFTSDHYGETLFTINPDSEQPNYFELNDNRFVYTDGAYFKTFTYEWLEGNQETALSSPHKVVLAKSIAEKFFPNGNALGETVVFNKTTSFEISGIVADPPENSDMPFDVLFSQATMQDRIDNGRWNSVSSGDQCYVLLKEGDDYTNYRGRLDQFVAKYYEDENTTEKYYLQPMSDLHFNENWGNYNYSSISKSEILVIYIIAIFLILTGCVNFINLSTAVAMKRAREVGIRKVLGGTRRQLVVQFLSESFGIIFISVLAALGLAELLIMYINPFLDVLLDINLSDPLFIATLVFGTLTITLLAGFYPAMVLSGFKPALALKNMITSRHSGKLSLRKGLVVFQFFISQVFVIGTIIIITQMSYMQNVNLGYKPDALINIRIPEEDIQRKKTLHNELSRISGVENVTLTFSNPTSGSVSVSNFKVQDNPDDFYSAMKFIDENYIDTYGFEILAGKNIQPSDTLREVIVNEKLLSYINHQGDPEEAIGLQLRVWGENVPIAGVVNDFHSLSLHGEISPIIMFSHIVTYRIATIKVGLENFEATNAEIRKVWKRLYPEFDYTYDFLTTDLANFYDGERKMAKVFTFFSAIAILIGCLGLFGLASFMVNQKVKEIGVRKVLGATVASIVGMFSLSFFKLIALAFVFAAPAAWYGMNQWLTNFEYKIEIGPTIFVGALFITLCIAVLTVGFKSVKAAIASPVDSLRDE
ncbi:MAG: ABC transporter permease [Bacteroidota bacterium]